MEKNNETETETTRICKTCNIEQDILNFKKTKTIYRIRECKSCMTQKHREYFVQYHKKHYISIKELKKAQKEQEETQKKEVQECIDSMIKDDFKDNVSK